MGILTTSCMKFKIKNLKNLEMQDNHQIGVFVVVLTF